MYGLNDQALIYLIHFYKRCVSHAIVLTIRFFFQGLKKAYLTSYISHTFLQVSKIYISISNNPFCIQPKNKQTNDHSANISKTLFQIQIGPNYLIPALLALTHDSSSNTTKL